MDEKNFQRFTNNFSQNKKKPFASFLVRTIKIACNPNTYNSVEKTVNNFAWRVWDKKNFKTFFFILWNGVQSQHLGESMLAPKVAALPMPKSATGDMGESGICGKSVLVVGVDGALPVFSWPYSP